ncbi:MAG TPA: hypothetical protein VIM58_11405 [Candidatus Methylacidiphilales bacterium]
MKLPLCVFCVAAILFPAAEARASFTWVGGGTTTNWNDGTNWSGGSAPTSGQGLVFSGTNTANSDNLGANFQFNGITFDATAGAFVLTAAGGNSLQSKSGVAGLIQNNSSFTQQINIATKLGADSTFKGNSMIFGGALSGSGFGINVNMSAGQSLTLTNGNTFSGATTLTSGTLVLGSNTALNNTTGIVMSGGSLAFSTSGFAAKVGNGNGFLQLNTASSFASVIDFGSAGTNSLTFASSSAQTWNGTLKIYNWTAGDTLAFGLDSTALTTAQLSDITFYSDAGATLLGSAVFSGAGGNLTFAAVPEPRTEALLALAAALVGLQSFLRRRRPAASRS